VAATAPTLPRILGRYALYDPIASGGMATVHFGRLLGPVGFARTVAIKRLHPQFAVDPEFVSMFLDEARLAARIRHPNVVPTLDVVAMEGELFLVMEYVQGESLGALLKVSQRRQQRVPVRYAVAIMAGALRGLHAAHEATDERGSPLGIVHRDVSPQNILVGIDGTPRVLDFGVAKAAGRLQMTRDGQLKGKIAFMPPEQIRGTGADRRTDVYAAGAVLWEALTGVRLFSGDNDVAVFAKVLEGQVAPPSSVAPGIPSALDAIVLQSLAMSPDARFPTARDMAKALEGVVPLVAPAEIGEWVETIGAERIASRTKIVSRIEVDSSTSHNRYEGTATEAVQATRFGGPALPSPSEIAGGAPFPGPSDASRSSALHSAVVTRPDRRWVVLGGVGALAALIVLGIVVRFAMNRGAETATETVFTAAAETASPPAVPRPPAPPPPPAVAATPPAPTPVATAAAPPTPPVERDIDDTVPRPTAAAQPPPPPPPTVAAVAPPPPVAQPAAAVAQPTAPAEAPAPRPKPRPAAQKLDGVLDSRK